MTVAFFLGMLARLIARSYKNIFVSESKSFFLKLSQILKSVKKHIAWVMILSQSISLASMYIGNKVSRKVSLDEIPSILTNLITLKKVWGLLLGKKI